MPTPPSDAVASPYHSGTRFDFAVGDHRFVIAQPAQPANGRPWIWRPEFFGAFDAVDAALLQRGWHVAHCPSAAGRFGSPGAVDEWDACYHYLTYEWNLCDRFVAEGFSRGGLLACNFAYRFPQRVLAMYNDAPVLDIRSWPGGFRAGKKGPGDAACCQVCFFIFCCPFAMLAACNGTL